MRPWQHGRMLPTRLRIAQSLGNIAVFGSTIYVEKKIFILKFSKNVRFEKKSIFLKKIYICFKKFHTFESSNI